MANISELDKAAINYHQSEIEDAHQYIINLEAERDALDDPWDREIIDGNIADEYNIIQSHEFCIQEILEKYQEDEP